MLKKLNLNMAMQGLLLVTSYWLLVTLLSGCVVRTYKVTKDRVDQNLSAGNRGYLKGEAPGEEKERKTTRTTQVVEIELYPPLKFKKTTPAKPAPKKAEITMVETEELIVETPTSQTFIEETTVTTPEINIEKYTVQKGDTLQKISQKFYGTTRKWKKIYELNKDTLKSPDKIRAGQVINIAVEPLKETQENLK
jgi:LysM repeat protein